MFNKQNNPKIEIPSGYGSYKNLFKNRRVYFGQVVQKSFPVEYGAIVYGMHLNVSVMSDKLPIEIQIPHTYENMCQYVEDAEVFIFSHRGHRSWIVDEVLTIPDLITSYFTAHS